MVMVFVFFFCKQKTAYEMRISDWSSDVCSSDLKDDDAEVGVVPAIDEHRLGRRVRIALGRRNAVDDGFQYFVDADTGLAAGERSEERRVGKGCVSKCGSRW